MKDESYHLRGEANARQWSIGILSQCLLSGSITYGVVVYILITMAVIIYFLKIKKDRMVIYWYLVNTIVGGLAIGIYKYLFSYSDKSQAMTENIVLGLLTFTALFFMCTYYWLARYFVKKDLEKEGLKISKWWISIEKND